MQTESSKKKSKIIGCDLTSKETVTTSSETPKESSKKNTNKDNASSKKDAKKRKQLEATDLSPPLEMPCQSDKKPAKKRKRKHDEEEDKDDEEEDIEGDDEDEEEENSILLSDDKGALLVEESLCNVADCIEGIGEHLLDYEESQDELFTIIGKITKRLRALELHTGMKVSKPRSTCKTTEESKSNQPRASKKENKVE